MSRKHVEDYYNQIYRDYHEMIETLHDMEKECESGLVSPDRVEQLKKMLEPIKLNYGRISYIMFLLNMPNKKEKQRWYNRQNAKTRFVTEYTLEGTKQEDEWALKEARNNLNK